MCVLIPQLRADKRHPRVGKNPAKSVRPQQENSRLSELRKVLNLIVSLLYFPLFTCMTISKSMTIIHDARNAREISFDDTKLRFILSQSTKSVAMPVMTTTVMATATNQNAYTRVKPRFQTFRGPCAQWGYFIPWREEGGGKLADELVKVRCGSNRLTLSLPRVINSKFPLQPRQKYRPFNILYTIYYIV